jgi:hypothetical protein
VLPRLLHLPLAPALQHLPNRAHQTLLFLFSLKPPSLALVYVLQGQVSCLGSSCAQGFSCFTFKFQESCKPLLTCTTLGTSTCQCCICTEPCVAMLTIATLLDLPSRFQITLFAVMSPIFKWFAVISCWTTTTNCV